MAAGKIPAAFFCAIAVSPFPEILSGTEQKQKAVFL